MTVGTALFSVTLAVLLLSIGQLRANGTEWLVWSCVTGIVLGLVGLVYTRRRREALTRHAVPPERMARQPEPPVRRPEPSPTD